MTKQEQELIDAIFEVRANNNIPWKRIIEIAMDHAPEETKRALRQVNQNDRLISHYVEQMTK